MVASATVASSLPTAVPVQAVSVVASATVESLRPASVPVEEEGLRRAFSVEVATSTHLPQQDPPIVDLAAVERCRKLEHELAAERMANQAAAEAHDKEVQAAVRKAKQAAAEARDKEVHEIKTKFKEEFDMVLKEYAKEEKLRTDLEVQSVKLRESSAEELEEVRRAKQEEIESLKRELTSTQQELVAQSQASEAAARGWPAQASPRSASPLRGPAFDGGPALPARLQHQSPAQRRSPSAEESAAGVGRSPPASRQPCHSRSPRALWPEPSAAGERRPLSSHSPQLSVLLREPAVGLPFGRASPSQSPRLRDAARAAAPAPDWASGGSPGLEDADSTDEVPAGPGARRRPNAPAVGAIQDSAPSRCLLGGVRVNPPRGEGLHAEVPASAAAQLLRATQPVAARRTMAGRVPATLQSRSHAGYWSRDDSLVEMPRERSFPLSAAAQVRVQVTPREMSFPAAKPRQVFQVPAVRPSIVRSPAAALH